MTANAPKVSIIIPTYNYGRFLQTAIDSAFAQTFKDFEVIVIDDGSTDDTKGIIQSKYAHRIKYIYQEHKGAPAARNRGFREAKGEYVVFLDADDWLSEEYLEYKVNVLNNNEDIGWVYSDWYYVDDKGLLERVSKSPSFYKRKLEGDISSELFSSGNYITTDAVLIRKACIEKVGGFDESLPALQDYDLWLRVSMHYRVKYLNMALSYSLVHSDSLSSQMGVNPKAFLIIAKKYENVFRNRVGSVKWLRLKADKYNQYGSYLMNISIRNEASKAFLKSILCFPFQKTVYKNLLFSLWDKENIFF